MMKTIFPSAAAEAAWARAGGNAKKPWPGAKILTGDDRAAKVRKGHQVGKLVGVSGGRHRRALTFWGASHEAL
jgi:hypothetical protein